jgi:hypothetical protein
MDGYDDLPPSEAARERRRDRDAEAGARAGMKSGLAKQFKQVLDSQAKRGKEAARKLSDDADRAERGEPRREREEPRQKPRPRPPGRQP